MLSNIRYYREEHMRELTHEDWIKNPTPRMMWVWGDETRKKKKKVIYFLEHDVSYPVVALDDDDIGISVYEHCAEIANTRRMTNKELSWWLRENPTREYKRSIRTDIVVSCFYSYIEEDADQEVDEFFLIRENDGEWREPFIEEGSTLWA